MYRFDLDTAIAAWRQSLSRNPSFRVEDLDELEMHLRDHVDGLVAGGEDPETAYRLALRRLGDHAELETAYRPRHTGITTRRRSVWLDAASSMRLVLSYLRQAWRSLTRNPVSSAINIGGLALGLAACIVIGLYVADEIAYDRFHTDADRIHRLEIESNGERRGMMSYRTPGQLSEIDPDVNALVRLFKHWDTPLVGRGDEAGFENRFYFADTTFFSFFSFEIVDGDPRTALRDPFSVVISESAARRLFGTEDPVGRRLLYNSVHEMWVTGVMADAPLQSHIRPDFVASIATIKDVVYTGIFEEWGVFQAYVKLAPGADPEAVRTRFESVVNNRPDDDARAHLTALTDIHLHSAIENDPEPQGDARTVRLLALTALLVLLIACINYMNLSTVRAMRRAREIGVRKVAGAARGQLVAQFTGESIVTALLALCAAGVAIMLASGSIRQITGKALAPALLAPLPLLSIVLLTIFVGLAAGSYPAFVLSRFQPARVLKGSSPGSSGLSDGHSGGRRLRQGLVVVQFAVSVVLVIGAMTLLRQMQFIRSAGLGFEDDQVLVVDVRDARIREGYETLRERWAGLSGVRSTGMSASTVPGQSHSGGHPMRRPGTAADQAVIMERNWIDPAYLETLEIGFVAGRPFRIRPFEEDAVVLNETAVRMLGWSAPQEAVGQTVLNGPGENATPLRVTGVVRDYHYESLHRQVGALMLSPYLTPSKLVVRLAPGDASETLARLRSVWGEMSDTAFIFTFLDDDIQRLYDADVRRGRLLTAGSVLAVLIACLGLLGLAAWTVDRRRREIGVRKVLGASAGRIVLLVTREFLAPVAAAVVIAIPVAAMTRDLLLRDFAYRAATGADLFVLGAGLLLVTATLTVSLYTFRAARTDPATSLRSE